jgi:hypothetical protein
MRELQNRRQGLIQEARSYWGHAKNDYSQMTYDDVIPPELLLFLRIALSIQSLAAVSYMIFGHLYLYKDLLQTPSRLVVSG